MKVIRIFKNLNGLVLRETMFEFNSNSYVVSFNDTMIGYFNIRAGIPGHKKSVSVEYELLSNFRGNGLGKILLEVIEKYIKKNFDVEEINLLIKYDNEKSKKVAISNHFQINYEDMEIMALEGEMTNYYPFYKNISKNKQKVLS